MAFSQKELAKHQQLMDAFIEKRRPPEHLRDKLDLSYRIENQSIVVFTIRPWWDDPQNTFESTVAKTTWVKSRNSWSIYWQPSDMKWHRHPYTPDVATLQEFITIVDEDADALFFG